MNLTVLKQRLSGRFVIIVIAIVYTVVFSFLSLRNHDLHQTFGWDLGFFDQLLWQASRGKLNFVSTIGNINLVGDHFQPMMFLMAPLYWLWDDVGVLLVAQAGLVAAAAYPLYLLGERKMKSQWWGLVAALAYLLYPGIQYTITNEVHQSAFIPLLLSLGLYWLEFGQMRRGLAALLALLLVREEMALLIAALGLMYLFKRRVKLGVGLLFTGGVAFFALVNVVIPAVSSQGKYIHYGYGEIGRTPEEVAVNLVTKPTMVFRRLVTPKRKLKQPLDSMAAFGGLPLMAPVSLIPILQQYGVRFLDSRNVHRWLDLNHYAAPLGPLLVLAALEAAILIRGKLSRKRRSKALAVLAAFLLVSSMVNNFRMKSPMASIIKPQLYFTPQWVEDAGLLAAAVPDGAAVATNNSLAPHLTHRERIYLLPQIGGAEYVAVDLSGGPNKYAPWGFERMNEYVKGLISQDWCQEAQFGQSLLLRRC